MNTDDLLARLSADLKPVQRVPHPALSALGWLAASTLAVAASVLFFGMADAAVERLRSPIDLAQLVLAGVTSALSAFAAFQLALPDRSSRWVLLPVPAAILWAATMGLDCVQEIQTIGWGDMRTGVSLDCLKYIVGYSVPLTAAFLWVARHAALMRPTAVAVLAGLASASVTTMGLSLVHHSHAALEVLVWHGGSTLLVVLLARAAAPLFQRLNAPALPGG